MASIVEPRRNPRRHRARINKHRRTKQTLQTAGALQTIAKRGLFLLQILRLLRLHNIVYIMIYSYFYANFVNAIFAAALLRTQSRPLRVRSVFVCVCVHAEGEERLFSNTRSLVLLACVCISQTSSKTSNVNSSVRNMNFFTFSPSRAARARLNPHGIGPDQMRSWNIQGGLGKLSR